MCNPENTSTPRHCNHTADFLKRMITRVLEIKHILDPIGFVENLQAIFLGDLLQLVKLELAQKAGK